MDLFFRATVSSSVAALILASSAFAQGAKPSLQVATPNVGQTIYGTTVRILISTQNFEVVDYLQNTKNKAGQGHFHLWLDEANPTNDNATLLSKSEFTFKDVPYGEHTLTVALVNNNHSPVSPAVTNTVNFKSMPTTIPSPAPESGFDKNTALVILIVVALVILAAWWYTKEEDESPIKPSAPIKKPAKKTKSRRSKT